MKPAPNGVSAAKIGYLAAAAAMAALFCVRVGGEIRRYSATYDEPYFIAAGYANLVTGDFRLRKDKPALVPALLAAPLLGSGVSFSRSDPDWLASASAHPEELQGMDTMLTFALRFLHHNALTAARILQRSRSVSLLCGLVLALLVGAVSWRLYGPWAGLLAGFFCTLSPNVLAHSGLATEDIFLTTFFFAAVASAYFFMEAPSFALAACVGAATALALLAKYTGVLLIPILVLLVAWDGKLNATWWRPRWREGLAISGAGAAVFLLVYRGVHLGEYFGGLAAARAYIAHSQTAFLAGHYSDHGFPLYFLIAVLLKTPLSMLLALAIVLAQYRRFLDRDRRWLLVPVAALLISASLSPMQIGHRHILPIYPFLFILAASLAAARPWALALFLIVPAYAAESISAGPGYLSYFNALGGGPSRGWHYLVDSNTDWGQDLGALGDYVRGEDGAEVILSYFGSSLPEAVGFQFQDLYSFGIWGKKSHVNSGYPKKELLAVSVTNLQGVYLIPTLGEDGMAWLKAITPTKTIGNTIKVYDITRDAKAHAWLAHMYLAGGLEAQARREAARSLALDPTGVWARLLATIFAEDAASAGEALKALAAALQEDPLLKRIPWPEAVKTRPVQMTYARSMTSIGNAYLARGDAASGTLLCQKAAQLDDQDADALSCLVQGLTVLGDKSAAGRAAARLREVSPGMGK